MKISDLIAQFIKEQVRHVFAVSGGANLHLLDSLDRAGVAIICPQSEAACGFAADAYARLHGLGVALATSGPGATNLVTAIATSFYDSVPVLYIVGQQTRVRLKENINPKLRQYGFQECPMTQIARPITKWAHQCDRAADFDPDFGSSTLITALGIAQQQRPGPVLLEIPDDLQRASV